MSAQVLVDVEGVLVVVVSKHGELRVARTVHSGGVFTLQVYALWSGMREPSYHVTYHTRNLALVAPALLHHTCGEKLQVGGSLNYEVLRADESEVRKTGFLWKKMKCKDATGEREDKCGNIRHVSYTRASLLGSTDTRFNSHRLYTHSTELACNLGITAQTLDIRGRVSLEARVDFDLSTTKPIQVERPHECLADSIVSLAPVAAVAERLARSPPTKANRVQTPAGSLPDYRIWESCRTMPLVGGFSRGSPVSPAPSFRRCSILTSITLIGSQDLAVKSRPNLFSHSSCHLRVLVLRRGTEEPGHKPASFVSVSGVPLHLPRHILAFLSCKVVRQMLTINTFMDGGSGNEMSCSVLQLNNARVGYSIIYIPRAVFTIIRACRHIPSYLPKHEHEVAEPLSVHEHRHQAALRPARVNAEGANRSQYSTLGVPIPIVFWTSSSCSASRGFYVPLIVAVLQETAMSRRREAGQGEMGKLLTYVAL
ncbi:hypothetical protein PR048_020707 [Dryococelus australis]|uniref:Uncharacterized protein n=1 Tax=Dryococelus australis TaxID=614101 RepID=A0ABQ9H6Y7_9NEOP|nr:hypothetical protein PR048_020707 [Dryococelus australis]